MIDEFEKVRATSDIKTCPLCGNTGQLWKFTNEDIKPISLLKPFEKEVIIDRCVACGRIVDLTKVNYPRKLLS